MDLEHATALETAAAVRSGEVTAVDVAEEAIARIEASDGPINAVVVRDFERGLSAAKALDAAGAKGDARPLIGVAMTVKESNDVAGLPTTWGMEGFKDYQPDKDAVVVERLKAAGAVILGKTNAPTALADWQSDNPIYGRTVNPLDHGRSPGGSSGGASAALAARMVPLEIGSDIGGSIRVPAHFCGVCGHKPTWGIVPSKGHEFPGTDGVDTPLAVVGPMARSVADLAATMDVIAGPHLPGLALDLIAPRVDGLSGLRVAVMEAHPVAPASAATRGVVQKAAEALANSGADVDIALDLPDLDQMHSDYVGMLTTVLSRGTPETREVSAYQWMDMVDTQMRATRDFRRFFEGVDILIAPVLGMGAFPLFDEADWRARELKIDGEPTKFGDQLAYAGLATYPGLPSTVIPVADDEAGMPIGVQIIAAPYADRKALAAAEALQATGIHP